MRVLHVMESTVGGTRKHLVDTARGLARAGVEVHVAASAERTPDFRRDLEELGREGCEVLEVPMVRSLRPLADRAHARVLERAIRERRPDIVHTHSSKAGALGRHAARRAKTGARLVHTPHTFAFLFDAMFPAWKRRFYYAVERRLAARTDVVIAVSESEARTIRESGVVPPERVRVVPNGIDPTPWLEAAPGKGAGALDRRGMMVPRAAPLAAVVGLLNVAKGQDVAIRALAEEPARELHLLIVGQGETRAELTDLVRQLGVGDRTHFVGWRADVPAVLSICDLVLVPSRWEGLPYIALEAMAAGLPLVCTRVDGLLDVVVDGETGYLAAPDSPAELAAALGRLMALAPEDRRALGEAGRRRVFEGFTLEHMIERLLAVYRELV